MGEREELAEVIWSTMRDLNRQVPEVAALAAADAILARRPADGEAPDELIWPERKPKVIGRLVCTDTIPADDGLVEMAAQAIWGDDWTHLEAPGKARMRDNARAALSVYRAHDPALRDAREALAGLCEEVEEYELGNPDVLRRARAALRKMEG